MIHQCNQCKKWQQCPGVLDWFPPAVIRFCPNHVRWLLEHYNTLVAGRWPRDPAETGYTQERPARQYKQHAYYETPIQMVAEIEMRIDQCGKDGALAHANLAQGYDLLTLANLMGTTMVKLERRVDRVVRYCSGWRRRAISYKEFVQHRKTAKSGV